MAISHAWPEWIDLMERLLHKGYLSPACGDTNHVRTACLHFARDRSHHFQYLSRKDILVMVRNGCLSMDQKVVNSAKRLRTFLGIEEAKVCSSCDLRGRCERAYAKCREEDDATTTDVMRILLTFGLGVMTGSAESKLFQKENIEVSARRILNSILEEHDTKCQKMVSEDVSPLSQVLRSEPTTRTEINSQPKNGDWVCSKCSFLNFSRNIRCLRCNEISQEKLRKLRSEREHLPLKRGDWICDTCNFLNFAKNSVCLQCNEKPANRQLNPGEWECTSCGFVNFRRNEMCLRCGWRRPKAGNVSETGCSPLRQRDICEHKEHEVATFWSSEEDGSDNDGGDTDADTLLGFEDFPVVGGGSTISRDPQERQKWMEEKKGRSRGEGGVEQQRVLSGVIDSSFEGAFECMSDDEDEMRGWFETRKYEKSDRTR